MGKLGEAEGRGVLVDSSSGESVGAVEGVGSEEPEPAAEEGVAARAPEAVARMVCVGVLSAVGEDVKAAEALPPPPPLLAEHAAEGVACEAVAVEDGVGG